MMVAVEEDGMRRDRMMETANDLMSIEEMNQDGLRGVDHFLEVSSWPRSSFSSSSLVKIKPLAYDFLSSAVI
jgi:hypothetical protein